MLVCVASPSTHYDAPAIYCRAFPLLQLAVATTAEYSRASGERVRNGSFLITTRLDTPRAHDYTVTRESKSLLDQDVVMRFGVSTRRTNKPRKDA
eukprot:4826059-Pleurochrysis_carterae.AAC.2